IPVAAIARLKRGAGPVATSARALDEAQGGFNQISLDIEIRLADYLIKNSEVPDLVPQATIDFLRDVNNEKRGYSLNFVGFDEWDGGRWKSYVEPPLAENEVLAMAELRLTPATSPRATAPATVAQIDTEPLQAKIQNSEREIKSLQGELENLPN